MHIPFFSFLLVIFSFVSSLLLADSCCDFTCYRTADISVGWRRDNLDWKNKDFGSYSANAKSHIHFKKIDFYTLNAEISWLASSFYIRCSADYGLSDKGRADQKFKLDSPLLQYPIHVHTDNPVKRRSEVYDFDLAFGYPFTFCDCRLAIIPVIGFSFHRQHLRVKTNKHAHNYSSGSFSEYTHGNDFYSSSSYFDVLSSNPFASYQSSNPFASSSSSDQNIAYELGLHNSHHTNAYRFTWYGFYIGTDIGYEIDDCWSLFSELEFHFLNRCHQKCHTWTGVHFVDDYHNESWAYGFNGTFGVTYTFSSCWYTLLAVDFKCWKGSEHHDQLSWKTSSAKIGVGYGF
jgi:hypothetical protein